ncbi:MAG: hypothetical protein ACLSA1_02045 [Alphaproteobacteria bacterium]
MIKLEYVVFFLLFAGSGAYVWHFFRRLRRDHFSKLVERAFLRRQASGGENAFFCEPLLRRIVVLLLRDGKKALRPLLALTLAVKRRPKNICVPAAVSWRHCCFGRMFRRNGHCRG